jgi:hypothetical protein
MAKREQLTQAELMRVLSYQAETGIFRYALSTNKRIRVGDIAGTIMRGYPRIKIDGTVYEAHRLAWLYVHGSWPAGQVDHINGVTTDNRISNLRDVTQSGNAQNRRIAQRNNQSGFLGVSVHGIGKWQADIRINGKKKYLGIYSSPEDAHQAYLKAKRELHKTCSI